MKIADRADSVMYINIKNNLYFCSYDQNENSIVLFISTAFHVSKSLSFSSSTTLPLPLPLSLSVLFLFLSQSIYHSLTLSLSFFLSQSLSLSLSISFSLSLSLSISFSLCVFVTSTLPLQSNINPFPHSLHLSPTFPFTYRVTGNHQIQGDLRWYNTVLKIWER